MAQRDCLDKLKVNAVHRRTIQERDIKSAVRGETARQAIGNLYPGCEIYGFTKGQFCLSHILEHCLNQVGPSDVTICTWSASSGDIQAAYRMMQQARLISRLRFIVDFSFKSRKPKFCQELVDTFGADCIRVTSIHSKFMTVKSESGYNLTIRTSMNLNYNPRFENFEISDDERLLMFMGEMVDEIWESQATYEGIENRPYQNKTQIKALFSGEGTELEPVNMDHIEGFTFG